MNSDNWSRRRVVTGIMASTGVATIGLSVLGMVHAQTVREINIVAQRFKFVPNVMDIKRGKPVLLHISSLDFVHGFSVPDLGIRSDLLPGMVTHIQMTPTEIGRLDFLCDNFCGDGHEQMNGHFNVTE